MNRSVRRSYEITGRAATGGSPFRAGKPYSVTRAGALHPRRGPAEIAPRTWKQPARRSEARRFPGATYILVALLGLVSLFAFKMYRHVAATDARATSRGAAPGPQPAKPRYQIDAEYVSRTQSELDGYLATRPGKYAVATLDLTTDAALGTDADTVYRAASVNKLELVVELYRRAVAKQIDLDATTVIGKDDIQNYGTGTIQLQGPGQVYSWRALARLMIEESDNTASYVIRQRLGTATVQAHLQSWGLMHTSIEDTTTTARDAALLLAQLQRRDLLPEAETREVLDMLQHTVWTDRLQSGVPAWLPVAHKIGTDVQVYNDAALFLDPQHPYVAVVLSSGADEADALATMTRISEYVYQFEARLPAATH